MEHARKNQAAEQGARNRIIEELRDELAGRDAAILEERSERVRMETLNEELNMKCGDGMGQLKEAQETMNQMMAHTQYQGRSGIFTGSMGGTTTTRGGGEVEF